jgi:hypothetical protein
MRIEKKKKTANPERERFQGKSSGESSLAAQGSSPGGSGDGSTGTAR